MPVPVAKFGLTSAWLGTLKENNPLKTCFVQQGKRAQNWKRPISFLDTPVSFTLILFLSFFIYFVIYLLEGGGETYS